MRLCRSLGEPEGGATLRGAGIRYHSVLLPLLTEDGVAIDHVLGAANYRSLTDSRHLLSALRKPPLGRRWTKPRAAVHLATSGELK